MKCVICLFFLILVIPGCENAEKAKLLQDKEKTLALKEQELSLLEQSLQLRESELVKKEYKVDSASRKMAKDSLMALLPAIMGMWNVKMNCTETTCPSSAVGDIKNEQWAISHAENMIIAKSISNDNTGRVYSGSFVGDRIELNALQDSTEAGKSTKMIVRLQLTKDNEMEGQRQIIRGEDCQIIYAVQLKKQP